MSLEERPSYSFYLLNFGPYLQLPRFLPLNQISSFAGPNGSGKSSLMDAIKTGIIANRRYIKYNPKGGDETTLRDYSNRFGNGKTGPTVICFHVNFNDQIIKYDQGIFGLTWDDNVDTIKFFFKHGISQEKSQEIINSSINKHDFLDKLNNYEPLKILNTWDSPTEYHKFLDEEGIMFFFPNNYGDLKQYKKFLKILSRGSDVLTSTNNVGIDEIKKQLFMTDKGKEDLEGYLTSIDESLLKYSQFLKQKVDSSKKYDAINGLISAYTNYYTEYKLARFNNNYNQLREQISKHQNDISTKETEIEVIENNISELTKKVEKILNNLEVLDMEEEIVERIEKKLELLIQKITENSEIFQDNIMTELDIKRKNLENKIIEYKEKLISKNSSLKRHSTEISLTKKLLEEEKIARKNELNKKTELEDNLSKIESELTIYREKRNSKIMVKNQINEINKFLDDLVKKHKKRELVLGRFQKIEEKLFELKQSKEDIINKKLEIERISGEQISIIEKDLLEQFKIKPFYKYFQDMAPEKAKAYESIFLDYKDYFVILKNNWDNEEQIIDYCRQKEYEVNLLRIDGNIMENLDIHKNGKNQLAHGSLIQDIIILRRKIQYPKNFGNLDFDKLKNEIIKQINRIDNIILELDNKKNNNSKIINTWEDRIKTKQKIIEDHGRLQSIHEDISEISRIIVDLGKAKDQTSKKIYMIRSEEEFNAKLNDLNEKIQRFEEQLSRRTSEIKDTKQEINEKKMELGNIIIKLQEFPLKLQEVRKIIDSIKIIIDEYNSKFESKKFNFDFELEIFSIRNNYLRLKERIKSKNKKIIDEKIKLSGTKSEIYEKLRQLNRDLEIENESVGELRKMVENLKIARSTKFEEFCNLIHLKLSTEIVLIKDSHGWVEINLNANIMSQEELERIKTDCIINWKYSLNKLSKIYEKSPETVITEQEDLIDISAIEQITGQKISAKRAGETLLLEISKLDKKLEEVSNEFIANSLSFIAIIRSQLKTFNKIAESASRVAMGIKFGTLKNITFKISKRSIYIKLIEFYENLNDENKSEVLNQFISNINDQEDGSLIDYFAKEISGDIQIKKDQFLDIYNYFDLTLVAEGKDNSKRLALKGSGGESTGVKFLVYSLIFYYMRELQRNSIYPFKKPIFLFFDEAAAVDDKGISSLLEITKKLDVKSVIAMVESPRISDKGIYDFILTNAVITPGINTSSLIGWAKWLN